MIRIFYGEDRVTAQKMIARQLGDGYEVIEAEALTAGDLPSVLVGASLFAETRAILIKDLSSNKECWDLLPKFVEECPHNVVIWETKLDKRSVTYKELSKNKKVEFKEFAAAKDPDQYLAFDTINAALAGKGKEALAMAARLETTSDAYMFMGLLVSQVVKKLQANNSRAPKILKMMAQADMDMKTTGIEPWTIVKALLLKISAIC